MTHPQALLDYWADFEAWGKSRDPSEGPVSQETATRFRNHIKCLEPLTPQSNFAKYAIASIYLVELIYSNEESKRATVASDRNRMTQLLCECAEDGMVTAFDNLVTSGIGIDAEAARKATKDHERIHPPATDPQLGLPVYSPDWMSGAMKLWQIQREC